MILCHIYDTLQLYFTKISVEKKTPLQGDKTDWLEVANFPTNK